MRCPGSLIIEAHDFSAGAAALAAVADIVFVAHAAPASKTAVFCREGWVGGKAMYTLDNPANSELISLGARPVTPTQAPLRFASL